jgi:hypothetical protein
MEVAEEYDRHRPTYPDALIDRACEVGAGSRRTGARDRSWHPVK